MLFNKKNVSMFFSLFVMVACRQVGTSNDEQVLRMEARELCNKDEFKDAEFVAKKLLIITEKKYGNENENVSAALQLLGFVYLSQKKYNEAEYFCNRALQMDEKCFGNDNPFVLNDLETLLILYRAEGKNKEAELINSRIKSMHTHAQQ